VIKYCNKFFFKISMGIKLSRQKYKIARMTRC
jgi:hypothetical protein